MKLIVTSSAFFINSFRAVGSALNRIKNDFSVLAHIGSVTNAGMDRSPQSASFYKRNQATASGIKLTENLKPLISDFQLRPEKHPMKIVHQAEPVKKRRAPLPPLSPFMITQLEKTIEKDKLSEAWFARFNSPSTKLTPTRRAPLPPLSELMISRLEEMIEDDRQSPERSLATDLKLAIKDVQFNMQMRTTK